MIEVSQSPQLKTAKKKQQLLHFLKGVYTQVYVQISQQVFESNSIPFNKSVKSSEKQARTPPTVEQGVNER